MLSNYHLKKIPICKLDKKEFKEYILERLDNQSSNQIIVTFNLDFFRIAEINYRFNELCINADIIVPDGIGIIYLLLLKYRERFHRITGNDILKLVFEISKERQINLAFLGSTVSVIQKVKKKTAELFPVVNVVYARSLPDNFSIEDNSNSEIIAELSEKKIDFLFVALGCPKQEFWIDKYKNEINAKFMVGAGATLDYYSGGKNRAPKFLQIIGFEWMWRMLTEPKRLIKRYIILDLPFFIKNVIKYKDL